MRWIAAVVLLAIVAISFSPVIALIDELSAEATTGLDGDRGVDAVRAHLVWTSLQVAGVATGLSIVWGLATASVIASRGRISVVIESLSWAPLLLPNVVVALGWLYIAGPGGYLGDVLPSRTGGASNVGGLLLSRGMNSSGMRWGALTPGGPIRHMYQSPQRAPSPPVPPPGGSRSTVP